MLMVHAEDNDPIESNIADFVAAGKGAPIFHALSRPVETEATAIDACLTLAQETGGRLFIVHMSSADRMEQIALARDAGCSIFAETCTHYLIFTEEMLQRDDGIKWICSPPLRKRATQERLWQGLQEGQVMMVTSDDAAFSWKAKLLGQDRFDKCPNGIPGIEPRFSLLYSEGVAKNRITVNKFVELIAETPAILFGLDTHKGSIKPGLDADIVLFDPNEEWIMKHDTLHMAADWSAYDNIPINGKIKQVFSRGELLIDGEKCLAEKGRGKYLHRVLQT
jgi:dihydropyrimidinase